MKLYKVRLVVWVEAEDEDDAYSQWLEQVIEKQRFDPDKDVRVTEVLTYSLKDKLG